VLLKEKERLTFWAWGWKPSDDLPNREKSSYRTVYWKNDRSLNGLGGVLINIVANVNGGQREEAWGEGCIYSLHTGIYGSVGVEDSLEYSDD